MQDCGAGCMHSEEALIVSESMRYTQTWISSFSLLTEGGGNWVPGCGPEWKLESELADSVFYSLSALLGSNQPLFEEAFRK